MRMKGRIALLFTGLFLCLNLPLGALAQPLEDEIPITLSSPSLLLMEADTGTVIFEKDADETRPVASVTKLMTVLLILERLEEGTITLKDQVIVSPFAASTTGSQVLLDANTAYPLETLLKSTIMASGNDSAVALAEYVAGTEEAFAELMNERAQEMQLAHTHYVNCTGLPASGQYTTARDVATLSAEVAKHSVYFKYSSVWLDTLTHPGGRTTDLTNTNRLVRFYSGCDGMKTGSTNEAKYCVCASAVRNDMRLIAVVLGAENSQKRFDEARTMLDYGFATYRRTMIVKKGVLAGKQVPVRMGAKDHVEVALGKDVSMLVKSGQEKQMSLEIELQEFVTAPVKQGDALGTARLMLDGRILAQIPAVAAEDVRFPGFLEGFVRLFGLWK